MERLWYARGLVTYCGCKFEQPFSDKSLCPYILVGDESSQILGVHSNEEFPPQKQALRNQIWPATRIPLIQHAHGCGVHMARSCEQRIVHAVDYWASIPGLLRGPDRVYRPEYCHRSILSPRSWNKDINVWAVSFGWQ